MTPLRLYDRLRDEIVDVEPSTPGVLRVYSCGPTVYGRIHVGNARPVLDGAWCSSARPSSCSACRRASRSTSPTSTTRSTPRPSQQGVPSQRARRRRWPTAYRADTDGLGLGRPDVEPLASETIAEIVALIERLIEQGAAYATADGDVYFSVAAYPHVRRALGPARRTS